MIDFHLDEELQLIRDTISDFAAERIRPMARDADENGTIPERLIAEGWQLGIVQSAIPEQYGGHGAGTSAVTGAVVAEGLAEGDLAIALHLLSPKLVVDPVLLLGSQEQQEKILPFYTTDSFTAGSAAVLEPDWRFDPLAMKTTVANDGDDYILDGDKCYVPLAGDSPWMVVYARDEEGKTAALLVERGTDGIDIKTREKNMGIRALQTFEVSFSGCRIPRSARLGDNADGLLDRALVAQSAMAVGVAKASLDYAIDYARQREVFGQKVAQKQAIAFMLADMAIEIDAARLLNWEAAWLLDRSREAGDKIALASRYAQETAMMVTDNGIQVLGGHGFVRDHPVEMWARNGRGFATFEGLASV
ncbi:MAG: acyl-CoA dehydrogenase family protein [Deltaproteobacteria bacterium]